MPSVTGMKSTTGVNKDGRSRDSPAPTPMSTRTSMVSSKPSGVLTPASASLRARTSEEDKDRVPAPKPAPSNMRSSNGVASNNRPTTDPRNRNSRSLTKEVSAPAQRIRNLEIKSRDSRAPELARIRISTEKFREVPAVSSSSTRTSRDGGSRESPTPDTRSASLSTGSSIEVSSNNALTPGPRRTRSSVVPSSRSVIPPTVPASSRTSHFGELRSTNINSKEAKSRDIPALKPQPVASTIRPTKDIRSRDLTTPAPPTTRNTIYTKDEKSHDAPALRPSSTRTHDSKEVRPATSVSPALSTRSSTARSRDSLTPRPAPSSALVRTRPSEGVKSAYPASAPQSTRTIRETKTQDVPTTRPGSPSTRSSNDIRPREPLAPPLTKTRTSTDVKSGNVPTPASPKPHGSYERKSRDSPTPSHTSRSSWMSTRNSKEVKAQAAPPVSTPRSPRTSKDIQSRKPPTSTTKPTSSRARISVEIKSRETLTPASPKPENSCEGKARVALPPASPQAHSSKEREVRYNGVPALKPQPAPLNTNGRREIRSRDSLLSTPLRTASLKQGQPRDIPAPKPQPSPLKIRTSTDVKSNSVPTPASPSPKPHCSNGGSLTPIRLRVQDFKNALKSQPSPSKVHSSTEMKPIQNPTGRPAPQRTSNSKEKDDRSDNIPAPASPKSHDSNGDALAPAQPWIRDMESTCTFNLQPSPSPTRSSTSSQPTQIAAERPSSSSRELRERKLQHVPMVKLTPQLIRSLRGDKSDNAAPATVGSSLEEKPRDSSLTPAPLRIRSSKEEGTSKTVPAPAPAPASPRTYIRTPTEKEVTPDSQGNDSSGGGGSESTEGSDRSAADVKTFWTDVRSKLWVDEDEIYDDDDDEPEELFLDELYMTEVQWVAGM
ncbi:hypothetical protein QBC46DRAFT_414334 [Diplogelasinospora grovesii]|uniref:Uncharacterized protein n=1 Tax=Diplogelasinospora grovesii TaxID=303347 RepID=A0AAN6MV02_9PEZI|nr:hypothetical protein QBC46DRAFT_414334 [Diplogelasinospora grovesii]